MAYKTLREITADIEKRGRDERQLKRYMESIQENIREVKRRHWIGAYPQMENISRVATKAIDAYPSKASEIREMIKPYKVALIRGIAEGKYHSRPRLELKVVKPTAILSILSLIGALFFVSFNLTGMSIGNLSENNFSLIGTGLFFLGLVFAFLFLKGKNKK